MKSKMIAKEVTAPQTWNCDGGCGGVIKAGEKCAKLGSKKYCSECVRKSKGGEK